MEVPSCGGSGNVQASPQRKKRLRQVRTMKHMNVYRVRAGGGGRRRCGGEAWGIDIPTAAPNIIGPHIATDCEREGGLFHRPSCPSPHTRSTLGRRLPSNMDPRFCAPEDKEEWDRIEAHNDKIQRAMCKWCLELTLWFFLFACLMIIVQQEWFVYTFFIFFILRPPPSEPYQKYEGRWIWNRPFPPPMNSLGILYGIDRPRKPRRERRKFVHVYDEVNT